VALTYPPYHKLFDAVSPVILQHQAHLQQNTAASSNNPASPVINLTLRNDMIGLGCAAHLPDPTSNQPSSSSEMLLNSKCTPGPNNPIIEFCKHYDFTENVQKKLTDNEYMHAHMFCFIHISELKEMAFFNGEIAALKDAVEQWSAAA
jgi:hypothetical protein